MRFIKFLTNMTNKDLIHQYVSTGTQLPEHQLTQLNTNQLKSYFRQRILAQEYGVAFQQYEYLLAPDEIKPFIIKSIANDDEFIDFLNGKSPERYETEDRYYHRYEPKIDFAALIKMILESYTEETQNPNLWAIKEFIVGMVSTPENQKIYNIKADTQEIYNIMLSTPDCGKDKTEMNYIYYILKTTDTLTPFKTFAKDKFGAYLEILKNKSSDDKWEKFGNIFKTTPIPKQIIELSNTYDSMGDAFLWYMPNDVFYGLLDSKHPLHRISLIPEKKVKRMLHNVFTKYTQGNPEEYAQGFTNPKEVIQIYNMYY